MDGCTVAGNASKDKGGGLYLENSGSIDLRGRTVIKDNDGTGTMDNLVMEKGAWVHDMGLEAGSMVRLRSTHDGEVPLAVDGGQISEYQMKNFFASDSGGGLKLTDQKTVSTKLQASAMSSGRIALIIGGVLIILGGVVVFMAAARKRKGGRS